MKIDFRRTCGAEVKDFTLAICIILVSGIPIHILSKHPPRLRPLILIPRVWINPGSLEPVAQIQDYMLVQTARGKVFGYDRGAGTEEVS
jgi:hypothetical protein